MGTGKNMIDIINNSLKLKDNFSKVFLLKYFESGFASLTKNDLDLLVYHALSQQTDIFNGLDSYQLSDLLKISEKKVKSIKLDAFLKYGEKDRKKYLNEIKSKIEKGIIKPELEGEKLKILLEDPILKREFEYAIKKLGYVVDFSFNKDIFSIKITSFIEAMNSLSDSNEKFEQELIEKLKAKFKTEKTLYEKIKDESSLSNFLYYIKDKSSNAIASKAAIEIASFVFEKIPQCQ